MIVYFPHIPKAGGQTLLQGFYQAFGAKNCIKVWLPKFGADVSPEDFPSLGRDRFEGISAVVGHLRVTKFLLNRHTKSEFDKGNVKIFASVRDPIRRILSLYNYISLNRRHSNHKKIKGSSPMEFVMQQPANFQYDFLKARPDSTLDEIFQAMDIAPVENSVCALATFFAKNFNVELGEIEIKNRSVDLAKGREILSLHHLGADALAVLENKHQIDLALYRRALGQSGAERNA